jgi:hypothetical protein
MPAVPPLTGRDPLPSVTYGSGAPSRRKFDPSLIINLPFFSLTVTEPEVLWPDAPENEPLAARDVAAVSAMRDIANAEMRSMLPLLNFLLLEKI